LVKILMPRTVIDSSLRAAVERLLDGEIDEAVSELGPTGDTLVVSLMLALLGVSVREKFGRNAPVSELASYAHEIQASMDSADIPPRWVIESVLRAGAGNSLLFGQLGTESPTNLYEGVGLILGYLLSDLDPDQRLRNKLIDGVIAVTKPALQSKFESNSERKSEGKS
jgi:hypothetical protein